MWENFPNLFTIAMNLCKSAMDFGVFVFFIANVFSGSALIPCSFIVCPKNFTDLWLKTYLSEFQLPPDDSGLHHVRLRHFPK